MITSCKPHTMHSLTSHTNSQDNCKIYLLLVFLSVDFLFSLMAMLGFSIFIGSFVKILIEPPPDEPPPLKPVPPDEPVVDILPEFLYSLA